MPKGQYPRRRKPLRERLSAKVDRNGPVPAHAPKLGRCHVWMGATNSGGYGKILSDGQRSTVDVHRAVWELAHGKLAPGLWVLHRCDNPRCVRLSHLFLGDHRRNMADMAAKHRSCAGERNGCAALTTASVRAIRANPGRLTGVALARQYGVNPSVICNILKGKAWRHLLP